MHKSVILSTLSKPNINIFDEIISAIEYEFNKPVTNISDMKERDNKKRKGDIWEVFCRDWLLASGTYTDVWLLTDFITQYPTVFLSKQDNGIDLIGKTLTGWHAIQCKYRSAKSRVDWRSLSTFIAMCERTKSLDNKPWDKHVVITNCSSVTHKLPRTCKDKSICLRSLKNTKRDHWLKIVGLDNYNTTTSNYTKLSSEHLRAKRLAYYA